MKKEKKTGKFWQAVKHELRENRSAFLVYSLLRVMVIGMMILQMFNGNFQNVFLCILTLVLLVMPSVVQATFKVEFPTLLEIIILLFIFAAEILGEISAFYIKFPYWDTVLHTLNGFLCAAIGFALIDILNRNEKIKFKLSPMFLAIVAFCFSMTIGVLWEFFEFFCDAFLGMDMQKDFVISSITSTYLGESTKNPVVIEDIQTVAVNGMPLAVDGYLDIGLYDTMKDLFVNFIGAVVFSIIGFFYVKTRGRGKIAKQFIPQLKNDKLNEVSEEKAGENK